jgi:hypothetical protein
MRKHDLVLFILIIPFAANAQNATDENYHYDTGDVFFGFSSGTDYHINAYRSIGTESFRFEEKGPRYNIGADLGIMATKRLRPRLELKYVRLAYGQEWLGLENVSYTTFKYTTTRVNYLDLNLHLDFLLLDKSSKMKVFISPAIKTEYALGASYKSKKTDGDTSRKKYADLDEYYPGSIAGAACSMIFKYELNRFMGLTFTPEYTKFFRPFQRVNTNDYQRLSFNIGIELHIDQ